MNFDDVARAEDHRTKIKNEKSRLFEKHQRSVK